MAKILKVQASIHETSVLEQSELGRYCEIGPYSVLVNTTFDDYAYAGSHCIFQNVVVGKFSNIAAYVRIGATDHPMNRPTLHHFTYRSEMYGFGENDTEFFAHRESRVATIGHDTWIGHGAMIKSGIHIANGAVVGQGAVVTKDVPHYAIVVGNPAKIIRHRFNPEIIEKLETIKWWDWSHEKIKDNFTDFRGDIEDFIQKHGQKEAQ